MISGDVLADPRELDKVFEYATETISLKSLDSRLEGIHVVLTSSLCSYRMFWDYFPNSEKLERSPTSATPLTLRLPFNGLC